MPISNTNIVIKSGSLYGTGRNLNGQLTGTSTANKTELTEFVMSTTMHVNVKPKYIACGSGHTIVLMTDGSLYGTGSNLNGQLTGTGNKSSLTKIDMPTLSDGSKPTPKYIACGDAHTVVLMTDGFLYGTGNNFNGQLTGSSDKRVLTKIDMPTLSDGSKPTPKYIACGNSHTIVLMTDGSLYGTGENRYGQLTGTTPSPYNIILLTSISDGVSYIADMMDYVDIHNYTVYFMKSIQI
jgi:alpha-tubulin suppressor-like RCC1 family protein